MKFKTPVERTGREGRWGPLLAEAEIIHIEWIVSKYYDPGKWMIGIPMNDRAGITEQVIALMLGWG